MKAAVLVRKGDALQAFETREVTKPTPGPGEILIKTDAFGLNFADVMARRGMYKEAPPLPAILGYDVAGTIEETGQDVTGLKKGDRVTAMTRFGGYAEYAITNQNAATLIPDDLDSAAATALSTQYCTAVYAASEMTNLHKGDKVLIQSGAGGVGTALIQYASHMQCEIFSTVGSPQKIQYLKASGVQHAINYNIEDFEKTILSLTSNKGVDVIFDAVGGKSIKKGMRILAPGGRMVCYGAAALNNKNIFSVVKAAIEFGFYHPAMLMMPSKSIIGINMLKIGDHQPKTIQRCLVKVMELYRQGVFKPSVAKVFPVADIGQAHAFLEDRKSTGKVAVQW